MKILIVEDEYTSRMQLQFFLEEYGECTVAENGADAFSLFKKAFDTKHPFDLICLDIKLPEKDGLSVLTEIRNYEKDLPTTKRSKIFMTTAMFDLKNVSSVFYGMCDSYLTKPIEKKTLEDNLKKFALL